ncbi:MAG: NTP transferase domain-containing protein, partial [Proteobacteria bacterium]|nr:NTP transferase domain-containing protein [Pseudomonadota bacterium]
MILAAGFGERVRPLSLVRPKPVFPVLNRPLIARTLDGLAGAGVTQVVVNAHHLAPVLAACLAGLTGGPTVHFLEEDRILGTGGGVKNAARYLAGEPFLLINGDVVTDLDLKALAEAYLAGPPGAATLAVHDHPVFNGGLAVDSGGVVRGF